MRASRYGTTIDCEVSGKDTGGAMCVLEINNSGWPRHVNPDQDEWIYVVEGAVELEIGKKRFHLGARESLRLPENLAEWVARPLFALTVSNGKKRYSL